MRIDRNIFALGWVSLFTDLSSEMIFPILPTFLSEVLGISKFLIGLIEGVAESTASLLKVFSGYLSDRIRKRKPVVLFGYGLSAVTKPLLALVSTWPGALLLRFLDRVGKGIRTSPRDAMIADYSATRIRGRAFGLHRTMDNLGAVLGTLSSFLLMSYFVSNPYRKVFLLSAIPGLLAFTILLFFVREKRPSDPPQHREGRIWSLEGLDRRFTAFLLAASIFTFSNFSYAFFLLRAEDVGVEARFLPLVYLLYNMAYLLSSYPAGLLSDRIGRKGVIAGGYLTYAVASLGFSTATAPWMVWPLFALYGLYHALVEGVSRAFVADLVPSERRATAMGLYHTTVGIVALPAGLFAGGIWDLFGPQATFLMGALLSALAFLVLILKVG